MYETVSNCIAMILLLLLTYHLLRNYKNGLLYYFTACLVGPYLIIGSAKVKFEIAAFFILFVISIVRNRDIFTIRKNMCGNVRMFLFVWFGIFMTATLFNLADFEEVNFFPSRIFGLFRFMFNLLILENLMADRYDYFKTVRRVYRVFLLINFPVIISQYMMPASLQFYSTLFGVKDSAPYANEIRVGFFTRGYGTSFSPTGLGMLCAFIAAFFVMKYSLDREKSDIFFLAMSIVEGALSGSKMFAFSIIIVMGLCFLVLPVFYAREGMIVNIRLLILGGVFLGIAMLMLIRFQQIERLVNYFINPLEQLNSRYSSTGSIGSADKTVLTEKFLIGYGATKKGTELIGDSMYYVMFHDIGITGVIWYLGYLAMKFIRGLRKKDFIAIVYFVLIIGMGVGDPLYFSFSAVIPTYYLLYLNGNISVQGATNDIKKCFRYAEWKSQIFCR